MASTKQEVLAKMKEAGVPFEQACRSANAAGNAELSKESRAEALEMCRDFLNDTAVDLEALLRLIEDLP